MRKHPRQRTWTLAALDRAAVYRLEFSHELQRWDLYLGDELVTTRPTVHDVSASAVAGPAAPRDLAPAPASEAPPTVPGAPYAGRHRRTR